MTDIEKKELMIIKKDHIKNFVFFKLYFRLYSNKNNFF